MFIKRLSRPLQIGHMTDTHVDVRADVYEANLKAAGKIPGVSFNNYNTDFVAIYGEARESPTWSS